VGLIFSHENVFILSLLERRPCHLLWDEYEEMTGVCAVVMMVKAVKIRMKIFLPES